MAGLQIVELSPAEVANLAADLAAAAANGWQVLVAIDGPPQEAEAAVKIKIRGGIWSPPLGREVAR